MNKIGQINAFDIEKIRYDFPILSQKIHGYPLVYLDNAATTQKPRTVIDAVKKYYDEYNANVHRGVHHLSVLATGAYEAARDKVRDFLHARHAHECIFVRGTTEAINLVAQSFVAPRILPEEEILITAMEHHSNIVPWQMVCAQTGAKLKVVPVSPEGEIDLEIFAKFLSKKTQFVALSHASNALGTINPIKKMVEMAHAEKALVLVDGAQAVPHLSVDVQDLDCDFYAFSGHKMYAPTGIGVLWGRELFLNDMQPYQGGGEMIANVTFEATEYAPLPHKFEAGTPNISGAIGLGAAIDYLLTLDFDTIHRYEADLLAHATNALLNEKGFNVMGTAKQKVPVLAFTHGKIHAHDIGTILDAEGIAVRSGHHCAMPLMDFFGVSASTRMSMSFYNTFDEIDACISALRRVKEVFA